LTGFDAPCNSETFSQNVAKLQQIYTNTATSVSSTTTNYPTLDSMKNILLDVSFTFFVLFNFLQISEITKTDDYLGCIWRLETQLIKIEGGCRTLNSTNPYFHPCCYPTLSGAEGKICCDTLPSVSVQFSDEGASKHCQSSLLSKDSRCLQTTLKGLGPLFSQHKVSSNSFQVNLLRKIFTFSGFN
jgi:hypothetical protein